MKHTASRRFWKCFDALPAEAQALARKNFELLKRDPGHPSLQFKLLGKMYSARVGLHHRAPGLPKAAGVHWFWIGTHSDYDNLAAAVLRLLLEPQHGRGSMLPNWGSTL